MNKKAVEMSVNTIIVIVIVLLILLIMAFLLTGGFQNFTRSASCESKGTDYTCSDGVCSGNYPTPAGWSCQDKTKVCCTKPLFNPNN